MGIVISALIFTFIVLVHELGHFLVGLLVGANPIELSIGFGKTILTKNYKGIAFNLRSIPLGGFVKFQKDSSQQDLQLRLSHKKQILVSFAGPLANFILSYVMLFILIFGLVIHPPHNKPSGKVFEQLPKVGLALGPALATSFKVSNKVSYDVAGAFIKITKEQFSSSNFIQDTVGPIGITQEVNQNYKKGSSFFLFYIFTMFLSISLGITNLIPLGILDGGRIMGSTLKLICNEKYIGPVLDWYDRASVFLIFVLIIFTTVKDLTNLIFPE